MRSRLRHLCKPEWILVLLSSGIYGFLAAVNHYRFQTSGYDLGIYMQAVWQYAHGRLPYSTILDDGVPLLGNHFGPILVAMAPLYRLLPYAQTLLFVQAVWVSVGVLPIYWWARKKLQTRFLPLVVGGLYLLHPGIQAALNFDFHLTTLATTFLAFVLYYGLEKKWKLYWLWFGLSLLVKEDLLLVLAMFGVYLWFGGDKKQGVMTTAVALGWFVVLLMWVMPAINPRKDVLHSADRFVSIYVRGGSITQTLVEPVAHPAQFWNRFINGRIKRRTQVAVVLPFGGLQLLSPLSWMLVAPIWYERFQSPLLNFSSSRYQYGATTATIFAFGTIQGLGWLWGKLRRRVVAERFGLYTSALMIGGFLVSLLWFNSPLYRLGRADFDATDMDAREAFEQAVALVPADAAVVAHDALVPRLANRDKVYSYSPGDVFLAEYVVLAKDQDLVPVPNLKTMDADVEFLLAQGYKVLWDHKVVEVLKQQK